MQPSERYDAIIQMLSAKEMVTIPELMEAFDISIETARRDLNYLAKENRIKKVYGGAILYERTGFVGDSTTRMREHTAEKVAIGRKCAELVHDGDTVFLGPGTTVLQVARHLKEKKNLTVITASLYAAMELLDSDVTLFLIGGHINKKEAHTDISYDTSWDNICPSVSIISASGITSHFGVTDFEPFDAQLMRRALSRSTNIVLAADNSKFGQQFPCVYCPLSDVRTIVTGAAQKKKILQEFSPYAQRFVFVEDYSPV